MYFFLGIWVFGNMGFKANGNSGQWVRVSRTLENGIWANEIQRQIESGE